MKEAIHASAHASLVGLAAMAFGLADATLIASFSLGAAGAIQYIPPRVWFVAPLCWMGAALVIALPSYLVSRRRGAALTVIGMITLFLGARFYAQPTARIAIALAAIAGGATLIWLASARWVASPKRVAAAFVAAAMAAAVIGATSLTRDEQPPQRLKPTPEAGPDVVIVFLDTVSYDAIFPQGASVDPRFGFLARLASRGVVFDRAYTPSPWTLPAHFSAVTGVPAHRLGIGFDHQQYDGGSATLAQRFRRRGYRTAAVISNTFLNRGTGFARGFETFEQSVNALDVCRTAPGVLLDRRSPWFAASVCNWSAGEVTRRAVTHVTRNDDRPLFLLLNYMDAHEPYYVEGGCERPPDANPLPMEVAPAEYRRRYYSSHLAALRCIDHHLGKLAAQLEQRKRSTVIAVLSDHGEQFGEHGLVRHGNSLYDRLLHVPFMISGATLTPRHVAEPISIEALPGMVMDIVDRGAAVVPGGAVISSLVLPGALGGAEQWSLIRGRSHLIQRPRAHALYDLVADPAEQRNLALSPAASSLLGTLARELAHESRSRVDGRSRDFRSLGYVQ